MFQEVGALHLSSLSSDVQQNVSGLPPGVRELHFDETHDLSHFRVIAGECESHVSQVIAIDEAIIDHTHGVHIGMRFLAVRFTHLNTRSDVLVASLHLPHSGDSDNNYMHAVNDITNFIQQYSRYIILLGGDWNAEPGQARFDTCTIPLTLLGSCFHLPSGATRFGTHSQRKYDYFSSINLDSAGIEDDAGSISRPVVIPSSGLELGSDHALIL